MAEASAWPPLLSSVVPTAESAAAWYDGNSFQCKTCDYVTSSYSQLGGHLASEHQASLEEGGGGDNTSPAYTKSSMMYQCHVCLAEIYHERSAISYHLHTAHGLDLDTYGRSYVVKQEKDVDATPPTPPQLPPPAAAPSLAVSAAAATVHTNHYNSPYLGLYNVYDPRANQPHHQHHGLPDPSAFHNGFVPRDHYERPLMGAAEQLERARHFDRSFHSQNSHHFR